MNYKLWRFARVLEKWGENRNSKFFIRISRKLMNISERFKNKK